MNTSFVKREKIKQYYSFQKVFYKCIFDVILLEGNRLHAFSLGQKIGSWYSGRRGHRIDHALVERNNKLIVHQYEAFANVDGAQS